uniref:THH1/TOM1/TOM3 domain-containing protein n=2 Tax=Eucampia antarctica TaxID=49252 RepID=A0A7S2RKW1_9STRA|mmetsp:Transcript_23132/g.22202  ORF Transcript_23132/g.22202 Transcript_23132/m.22202 type:complete len:267 (+) Transcript_23132:1-801(+)
MSMVYATCFLITLVWVLPALYQQFHIKMSDKPKNRQKLHFKMWTSSLICLFVYGGRTINFIWNLVRSWNGQFYSSDDTKQYDHFTSFFNTSLGRDAVLNLCLELIPACIIVHLMRSPTRKQQQHQQQEQHQSSTPPIATVLHNSSSSSPLTPTVDQYTQPGQMTRSMSARGSDHHLSINIHTSTTTNNYLTNNNNNNTSAITNTRLYDSVGMKRAVSAKAATTIISTKPKPTPMEHVALLGNGANNNNNNAGVTTYGSAAMGSDKV